MYAIRSYYDQEALAEQPAQAGAVEQDGGAEEQAEEAPGLASRR